MLIMMAFGRWKGLKALQEQLELNRGWGKLSGVVLSSIANSISLLWGNEGAAPYRAFDATHFDATLHLKQISIFFSSIFFSTLSLKKQLPARLQHYILLSAKTQIPTWPLTDWLTEDLRRQGSTLEILWWSTKGARGSNNGLFSFNTFFNVKTVSEQSSMGILSKLIGNCHVQPCNKKVICSTWDMSEFEKKFLQHES